MTWVRATGQTTGQAWSPWRTVVWFGLVSLAADLVYEGARSITGPFLASLGASALVVGLVTGVGEGAALALRLVSGPVADRTGRYWSLTIVGYALTAVCVPLLAVAPFLGGAGLAVGATLVVLERTGKAIRSPAKSALLAHAAGAVGRGRGFGVHKALDQVGAFSGPLLVAGVIALTGRMWTALAVLAVPAALAMVLLLVVRARVPDLAEHGTVEAPRAVPSDRDLSGVARGEVRLPRAFYLFASACAASTVGLMTFGVISYHLVEAEVVTLALVPVVYAAAMAAGAVSALVSGGLYDRVGGRVLLVLPVLVAAVPLLAFDTSPGVVLAGVLVWGAATGLQDSTVKALVADLVPVTRLATAYGVFAAFQGAAALAGGVLGGALYDGGVADLVTVVAACQVLALGLLVAVLRRPRAGAASFRRH